MHTVAVRWNQRTGLRSYKKKTDRSIWTGVAHGRCSVDVDAVEWALDEWAPFDLPPQGVKCDGCGDVVTRDVA